MRENLLKRALKRGQIVIGTMICESRTPSVTHYLQQAGFDFFILDMEHGAYSIETVADIVQAARLVGITPLVRVSDLEYHLVARPLDAGAMGVMIPRVESRDDAERAVRFMKYPPLGERGVASGRGHTDLRAVPLPELVEKGNAETLLILQIEKRQAIENIEALVAVEGVDVALIGPHDLSVSLGLPGELGHSLMTESIQRVVDACRARGVASGIHSRDLDALKFWRERGMRLLMYSSDFGLMASAGAKAVQVLRAS